jgi:hypothetical protein
MIDCSDTETLAINLAFEDSPVTILYCYWHLWEAWDVNIKKKVILDFANHVKLIATIYRSLSRLRVAIKKIGQRFYMMFNRKLPHS